MSAATERMKQEVAETKTVIGSAKTLIANLAQRLRDALASNDTAALNAMADELDAAQGELAAAVAAGTVAENETAPEPGTGGDEV